MTIEKKNQYFIVKNTQGKIIYKGKDEKKANSIYNFRQQQEVQSQILKEKINFGFRF